MLKSKDINDKYMRAELISLHYHFTFIISTENLHLLTSLKMIG